MPPTWTPKPWRRGGAVSVRVPAQLGASAALLMADFEIEEIHFQAWSTLLIASQNAAE